MIVRAQACDASAITAMMNDVITGSTATFTTVLKTEADVLADIAADWPCLVLKEDAQVVGYARYFPFRPGPGYAHVAEYSIALTDAAKGRGQAAALLSQLCSVAQDHGITQLIGAVSSSNDAALRFHLAQGFAQVGLVPAAGRKWGQTLDLILMQKRL